jgi:hypothetical protein
MYYAYRYVILFVASLHDGRPAPTAARAPKSQAGRSVLVESDMRGLYSYVTPAVPKMGG